MKAIKILIYLLIISMNTSVNAQECYTPSSAPPAWLFTPVLRSTATQSAYTLRVYFHIVRNNGGNGLSANILSTMLSRLNTEFTATGIQFQSIGYEFIDNSTYYDNLSISEIPLLCAVNSHSNAIDIYVLGTSTTGMTSGVAANIPATAYIVHGSRYNTTTVTHEMGHCLGLYHTHHGTVTEVAIDGTNPDPAQCRELVNGSNAATCGDYITDTPADPNYWNNCNYIGGNSIKDDNYQIYSPNPANYMAYSSYTCRNMFTPAQGQRMRDFIANTPILQNVVVLNLSGPTSACYSGATYTLNNATGTTVQWNITGPFVKSNATNTSVTIARTGTSAGSGTLTASIGGAVVASKTITTCVLSVTHPYAIGPSMCETTLSLSDNLPASVVSTMQWSVSPSIYQHCLTSNGASATFTKDPVTFSDSESYTTLTFTCSYTMDGQACTAVGSVMLANTLIMPAYVGVYNSNSSQITSGSAGTAYTLKALPFSSSLSYYWNVIRNSSTILQSNSASPTILFPEPGDYVIRLNLYDACGNPVGPPHLNAYFTAQVPSTQLFTVYPNPVSGGTPLHLGLINTSQTLTPATASYYLMRVSGGLVTYNSFNVNSGCDINISSLSTGQYAIAITYNGSTYFLGFYKN